MISVLLPTYARPEFLAESIECFLRQTYQDSELIVLNDWRGHTIAFDHPRVRVFNGEGTTRRTIGEVRNWLCEKARGNLVVDWDDDDLYLPNHLDHALSMMSLYRGGKAAKQRWQWKWRVKESKLFRICPAGYLHTAIMDKATRDSLGGYAAQTRHSDAEFIGRIIRNGLLLGPGKMFHKPTFIQRLGAGREQVSTGPDPLETDVDRHARVDREAEALGITGNVVIDPHWNADYLQMAEDSYAAVLATGWGK